MIKYRDTHDVDLDQLAQLSATAGWERDKETLRLQVAGSRWISTAWDGARLVGFARAISDGVKNAYVCSVVVHPDFQARGVGREIVRRLMVGRDGVTFALHARPEVQAFYEKCGFAVDPNMMRRPRR